MKHSLILSLCVAVLASFGISSAQAATDVSLNLYYTDPADASAGGTWNLVVKTDAEGVVGLAVNLDPNTIGLVGHEVGSTTVTYPSSYTIPSVTGASIGHDILSGALGINDLTDPNEPGYYEFLYGQDPNGSTPGYVSGVGAGGPGVLASDPLNNSTWDGASIVASGVFGSTRPAFAATPGEANELSSGGTVVSQCATGGCLTFTVRGDSLVGTAEEDPNEGLLGGDINRDGQVTGADAAILGGSWQLAGTWDSGDVNSSGTVTGADAAILGGNWQQFSNPPTIGAVPEPATMTLLGASLLGVLGFRRRL